MNVDSIVDIVSFDSQIATVVTYDNVVSDITPLGRSVESLIDVSIESERYISDLPVEREVFVSILKRFHSSKIRIRSNHRIRHSFGSDLYLSIL